ncbi:MAG: two-component system, NarL family, sensor kinase [Solirubrobacteraceae bacterium]|nr:two-component system, NarL family, sensor kinase [Solirubrobacteraceae bacterium]
MSLVKKLRDRFARRDRDSTIWAVSRFMLGSLVAIAVVVVGGFFSLRGVTIRQAEANTRDRVQIEGQLVAQKLQDGIVRRDQAARDAVGDVVEGQILSGSVVRVKIWSRQGVILYSDENRLIGQRFQLPEDELALFDNGGVEAELSDLTKPENRFERPQGKLLEAHTVIRTPDGTPVLFEIYQQFESVNQNAGHLLSALAPPLIGGLVVLLLFQAPLAWSMARRLQRGHHERELLLASAIEASDQERRRIAADLHDGVVQDIAGVAFGLAPLAEEAARRDAPKEAAALRDSVARLRQGVRGLRTLLVEIHPPTLESAGLEAALHDLLSPLVAAGIATELFVADSAAAGSPRDSLIYRAAREAVRNAQSHADARMVCVEVSNPTPNTTRLVVTDDGRGFAPGDRARRQADGHVGLTLLEGLVKQVNGTLEVTSEPGKGTRMELEVPTR